MQRKVSAMRMLLKASFDTEKANEAIRNGTLSKLVEEAVEHIKPEAAYFTADEGLAAPPSWSSTCRKAPRSRHSASRSS